MSAEDFALALMLACALIGWWTWAVVKAEEVRLNRRLRWLKDSNQQLRDDADDLRVTIADRDVRIATLEAIVGERLTHSHAQIVWDTRPENAA